MSQPAAPQPSLTVEEYFLLEETNPVRHEYVGGVVYSLAGAGRRHNLIKTNIDGRLWQAALETECQVVSSDMRLQVTPDIYYYPDVMVICDPNDRDEMFARNPCLVAEVLSPSTQGIDRREKVFAYRQIASLDLYLIVHTETRLVEWHWRDTQRHWWQAELIDDAVIPVPCLQMQLRLAEIYRGIAFER